MGGSSDRCSVTGLAALLLVLAASCSKGASDVFLLVNAAPTLDGELRLEGDVREVAVSPDGRIWLASTLGQIAVTDSVLGAWSHRAYRPMREDWPAVVSGIHRPSVFRLTFFTPDTAIATGMGFVPGPWSAAAPRALLRTTDGGETWDTILYGSGTWIQATFATSDGVAWIGGGSEGWLMKSTDYGSTWQTIPSPFDTRISALYMESTTIGVAAGLWNRLAITDDGGTTWTDIPTPFDQGAVPEGADDELEDVILWNRRIIVRQGNMVFQATRDSTFWRPLPGGPRFFAIDRLSGRLYAVNGEGEVLLYDDDLRPTRYGTERLHIAPKHMSANGDRVVVLDLEGALYEFSAEGMKYSFPLVAESDRRMRKVRRHGGRLWGVTEHQIYLSEDMGLNWDRVGFTPTAIRSFLVREDGRLVIWDGHGRNVVFDPDEGSLRSLEDLSGYDVVDILQIGGRWIAFGGRQYETMRRVEISRTFFAGQFEGSRANGFVLVSEDQGETWTQVDEWTEGGVANLFVGPGGDMVLVSYLGGVRRLVHTDAGYTGEDLILPTEDTWRRVPYVEVPSVVFFQDARQGFIDGWIHIVGERRYVTDDGGRSWSEATVPRHDIAAVQTSYGSLVLRGSETEGGTELALLRGLVTRTIWRPDRPQRGPEQYPWRGITDFSVDDQGGIIALLDEVQVVVLEPPREALLRGRRPSLRR